MQSSSLSAIDRRCQLRLLNTRDRGSSDVNKDLTFKDKDQTPKDKVNYNQYRVKLEKIFKNNAKRVLSV